MSVHQLFQDMHGSMYQGFPAIHSPVYYADQVPYLKVPGVVVLSKPATNITGLDHFLDGFSSDLQFPHYLDDPTILSDGLQLCKAAGQICYMSFGPKRSFNAQVKRYLDNLKSSGHGSIFEHANYSLFLYGVSRSLTHELVRHRSGLAYSQTSQRYVSWPTLRFVERPEFQQNESLHTRFLARIERTAREYQNLDELLKMEHKRGLILAASVRKQANQAARALLPNETEAPIVVTGNIRAWRHVIEQRASAHAEREMRMLALRIFLCLQETDPLFFDDYVLSQLPDGTYTIQTEWRKI